MHEALFYVLDRPYLFIALLFVVRLLVLTGIERRHRAHEVAYRRVFLRDVLAALIYTAVIYPVASMISSLIPSPTLIPQAVLQWPLGVRLVLYVLLADLAMYWTHRLMHTRHFWRIHKWHHYPTYMYWLAGARVSLLHQVLINVPFIVVGVLLQIAPWWMAMAFVLKDTLQNDWMHLNVPWGGKRAERIFVTPRYHHVHHSDNPEHYRGNLGSLFSFWDHLFGTYVDPESVSRKLHFGIGERVPLARLVVGV